MSEYAVLPATGGPGGGGTEYVEDAASPANPTAPAISLRRRDAPASEVTTAGDWITANATPYGSMFVQIVTSTGAFVDSFGGAGGTSMADDAVFTPATTNITPFGAYYDDTSPDPVDEGDGGVVRMSADRILYNQTPDRTATATLGALNAAVTVEMKGRQGVGLQITTANLNATVVYEVSMDGGTTWSTTYAVDLQTLVISSLYNFTGGAATIQRSAIVHGATHFRARVSVYTSGTSSAALAATADQSPAVVAQGNPPWIVAGVDVDGSAPVGWTLLVGGQDGTNVQNLKTDTSGRLENKIHDGTNFATIRDLASNDALNVAIVDGSGNQITSFGGGTEYTEDVAAPADPVGATFMMTRDDQLATVTEVEGDWSRPRGTSKGALWVALADSAGDPITSFGGGTEYAQGTATTDTDALKMAGAVRRDTAAVATGVIDGDRLVLSTDSVGRLRTTSADTTQPVSATDLDIRNLNATDDIVQVRGAAADGAAVTGNPVLIAGSDNTNAQTIHTDTSGDLQVDVLTMPSVTVTATDLDIRNLDVAQDDVRVGGMAAHDAAVADNPVAVGLRASTALPTAVSADGDAVWGWANRNGAQVVAISPHIGLNSDPYNLIHETAQYTTTQTSTVLVAGGASEKLVVTKVQIQVGGTTAGTLQLYFGTAAYSRGTSRAIFDGEFAPSATLKPGVVMDGPWISGTNGDDLLVTTSAAINPLTITVWYYVVT